ncbi:hypothetical protein DC20_13305 [Rufibacter tibetensis]|uniref:2Fe-2S ferredoxin-type domain-containing protein n=1 Tax=Rufibacter tibetensis TaxID=512763 RepID=A0A0P0C3S9_9BACT|nr:hypothetical protein DC20_13305 [Rufibacter tibetensis]
MIGGIVSNHIIDEVKIGDSIEVLPPMGDFIFEPTLYPELKHIYLWGAGSGITPLFSITKHILVNHPHLSLTLVYGNRSHESAIFHNKILELEQNYPQQLKIWHFHTKLKVSENDNPYLIQGRINPSKVLAVMEDENHIQSVVHYICGPAGLKESVKEALSNIGTTAPQIFSEDFELVKNPKDFEGIKTQHVEISLNQVTTKVEVIKGKSILEAGLDASVELNYSCQTGNCTVCKGKVVSGEVKTIGPEKLPEDLALDEYLLCCSYPLTENVKIEVTP